MPNAMPGEISENLSNRMSEYIYISDRVPSKMSVYMSDKMSERMPDKMQYKMSEKMLERMSDKTPDKMSEKMSKKAFQNVYVR